MGYKNNVKPSESTAHKRIGWLFNPSYEFKILKGIEEVVMPRGRAAMDSGSEAGMTAFLNCLAFYQTHSLG